MVRYLWDGRVQTMGYSPYDVTPADPAMAATHTDETRQMPSLRSRTPYPPGAQLFFRLVVSIHDSTRAMKVALVACDLMTILILWRWLALTGRPEWLVMTYAWNPLVVLEIAHSGHLDALGAMWIAASAYWLARRRTALASVAYVLAVATKLLPIVLLPLYWRRVRLRDGAAGLTLSRFSILPTRATAHCPSAMCRASSNTSGSTDRSSDSLPGSARRTVATAFAVGLGLVVALWARWRLDANDPAAWAWPMAAAIAAAPVIYPWYLLYLTPFLFGFATIPIMAWTVTIIPTYVVWMLASRGGRWVVPPSVMRWEYGIPIGAGIFLAWRVHTGRIPKVVLRGSTISNSVEPAEPWGTP